MVIIMKTAAEMKALIKPLEKIHKELAEGILSNMEIVAKNGSNYCISNIMSKEDSSGVEFILINLGYKVQKRNHPFQGSSLFISW